MRKTSLRYSSVAVILFLVLNAILFAQLRVAISTPAQPSGNQGAELFVAKGCAGCHFTDSRETKVGPGLQGLFQREELPVSGREATAANVKNQLLHPYRNMPSFADRLSEAEINQLIEYLRTL